MPNANRSYLRLAVCDTTAWILFSIAAMGNVLIAVAYLQHLLHTATVHPQHLQCIYSTCYSYFVSTAPTVYLQHLLQLLCIHNTYSVSTASVTATVHPQHLQCIYSTCYSYYVSTTPTVYLQHLLEILCIHNNYSAVEHLLKLRCTHKS
jgi:hypothetical protein